MVLTVKVETDSGVALAKFIFSHYFILSTIFDRHVGDFQSGKVWVAIFFDRDLYQISISHHNLSYALFILYFFKWHVMQISSRKAPVIYPAQKINSAFDWVKF